MKLPALGTVLLGTGLEAVKVSEKTCRVWLNRYEFVGLKLIKRLSTIADFYKRNVKCLLPVSLMRLATLKKILATVPVETDLPNMTRLLRSTEWLTIPPASSKQHAIDTRKRWQAATAVFMPFVMKVQEVRSAIVRTALSTGATVLVVSGAVSLNFIFPTL